MAQTKPDLDEKCLKARPWVRRFMEEHQDGTPWGYAVFKDPSVDKESMDECMSRIGMLLETARTLVFGRSAMEFPQFKLERLDWPKNGGGEGSTESAGKNGSDDSGKAGEKAGDEAEKSEEPRGEAAGSDDKDGERENDEEAEAGEAEKDEKAEEDLEDEELKTKDDNELRDGKIADGEIEEEHGDADDYSEEDEEDEEEDDAYIETVKQLPTLRMSFQWARDHGKKRRKVYSGPDIEVDAIPKGLLRNTFILIDEDSVESIIGERPFADKAWVWAIDPDFTGDATLLTKNGLTGEYCGYMRVRVQQLVNNFWDLRHFHEDEWPLQRLWEAAKQSHNCAFVSVDPAEARMLTGQMDFGSALRAQPAGTT